MADRNFNEGNQSYQSNQDWEREKNRLNQQNDWSQQSNQNYGSQYRENQGYRDVGYSGDSAHGMEGQNQGNYSRVNYLPDNDENRSYDQRNYENTQYGNSDIYGRREGGRNYNQQDRGYGNAGMSKRAAYGNQYRDEDDWRRGFSGQGSQSYNRQDWGRGNVNTGNYDSDDRFRGYGNRGTEANYGNTSNFNRQGHASLYGGDTSNHGNLNQGGTDQNWWDKTKDKVSSWFSDEDDRRNRSSYAGGHRGKGPSDYRRSQDRIREDICDRLTDDDRVDASNIRVQMEEDAVILSGTVNTREEKRRAEDLVESISGVRNVENRLRIEHHENQYSRSNDEYSGYTHPGRGVGAESGTTNEILRNSGAEKTDKGKNRNS